MSIPLQTNMVIDSKFTLEEQNIIITSIHQWETDTDGLIKINLSVVDEPLLYGNDTDKILQSNDQISRDNEPGLVLGNTTVLPSETKIIIYTKSTYEENIPLQHVMLHEFGHAVGLWHTSQGIMTPVSTDQICLDQFTLNNFCSIHNCNNKNIKSDCQ